MSVSFNVQTNSPSRELPQCATVSISEYPAFLISQFLVRMGIWFLSRIPGLVVPYSFFLILNRFGPSLRSICRGLIARSSASVLGSIPNFSLARFIQMGSSALSLTLQGYPAASQIDSRIVSALQE